MICGTQIEVLQVLDHVWWFKVIACIAVTVIFSNLPLLCIFNTHVYLGHYGLGLKEEKKTYQLKFIAHYFHKTLLLCMGVSCFTLIPGMLVGNSLSESEPSYIYILMFRFIIGNWRLLDESLLCSRLDLFSSFNGVLRYSSYFGITAA